MVVSRQESVHSRQYIVDSTQESALCIGELLIKQYLSPWLSEGETGELLITNYFSTNY